MIESSRYQAEVESFPGGQRIRLHGCRNELTFDQFLEFLEQSESFRTWYTHLLVDTGPDGYFWELPPLTRDSLGDPAEFVLVQSLFLSSLIVNRAPFDEHFQANPGKQVIAFDNLGGDALLIVPTPVGPEAAYPHFATFLKKGPADQVDLLWQEIARQTRLIIGTAPRWLSTAGLGVSWVHLRLDTRPKYYRYDPYKR